MIPLSSSAASKRARSCRGCSKRCRSVSIPITLGQVEQRHVIGDFAGEHDGDRIWVRRRRRALVELTAATPERIERAVPGRKELDWRTLSDGGME